MISSSGTSYRKKWNSSSAVAELAFRLSVICKRGKIMADIIVIAVLILAVGLAVSYIRKAKKNGSKCIGCPFGGACNKKEGHSCSCHVENKN